MAVTGTVVIYLLLISLLQKTLQAKSFLSSQSQKTAENASQNLYSQIEPLIAKVINSEWTEERIDEIADRTVEKMSQLLKNGWTEQSRPKVGDSKVKYGMKEEERDKRLMGIFRCTGWGPGCTPLNGKMGKNSKGRSKFRQVDMYNKMYRTGGQIKGSTNSGGGGGGRINHGGRIRNKFQPFFTLTSGGSWGPTGRKRSLSSDDVMKRKRNSSMGRSDVLNAEKSALRNLLLQWEKEHPQEANADPDFSLVPDQRRIRMASQTPGNTIPTEEDGILLDSSPEAPETSNQSEQNYYIY